MTTSLDNSDEFRLKPISLSDPFTTAESVTPHDTNDLNFKTRALYIGTSGDVKVLTGDGQAVTFSNHPVGWMPGRVVRVYSTGTTASNIVAVK